MSDYSEPETSTPCYKVYREIAISDEKETQSSLSEKMDMSLSQIRDVKHALLRDGFIEEKEAKYGRKELSVVNEAEKTRQLFDGDADQISDNLIEKYIVEYCRRHSQSKIERMMTNDFVSYLVAYSENKEVPDNMDDFLDKKDVQAFDSEILTIVRKSLMEVSD